MLLAKKSEVGDTGKFDASQWPSEHVGRKPRTVKGNSIRCSCPIPSSDELQCFATVTSHLGTFFSAIALAYFISPGLIKLGCNPHNGTEIGYKGTQNYDCNTNSINQFSWISGSVGFALFMLTCAITLGYRWCSNKTSSGDSEYLSLIDNRRALSCCAPSSTMLQRFASHLGAFLIGAAASLFASLGIIKLSCGHHNGTEIGYNNTDTYDCNINSVARQNSICGSGWLGLGILMYAMALVADRWNSGKTRNVTVIGDASTRKSFIDQNGTHYITVGSKDESKISEADGLKKQYQVQYMEKYIEAYPTKFCEEYDNAHKLARTTRKYENDLAHSYANEVAKRAAATYAQGEALKHVRKIDGVMSYGSEHISRASSTSTGTDSVVDEAEKLKRQFPNKYMHHYIEEYELKFCSEYKTGQAKNAQDAAIEHAKTQAVAMIENYIELNEDRSIFDET